jgi:plasmid stabilization system protein ParE
MIYSIDFRPEAMKDIVRVFDYIEYELFNPMAAKRFLNGLDAKIDRLRVNAGIFAKSTYKDVLKYDIAARHVVYKGFAIIYAIHGERVVIYRVIHGSLIKE